MENCNYEVQMNMLSTLTFAIVLPAVEDGILGLLICIVGYMQYLVQEQPV